MKQTDSKGLQAKRTRVTILLEQIQTVLLKLVKKISNINCFIHVIFPWKLLSIWKQNHYNWGKALYWSTLKWDQNPFTLIEAKLLSFDLLIVKIIGRHRALLDVYQPDHSIFVKSYLISHIFVHNTRPQYM